jgi:hypothetical protein
MHQKEKLLFLSSTTRIGLPMVKEFPLKETRPDLP